MAKSGLDAVKDQLTPELLQEAIDEAVRKLRLMRKLRRANAEPKETRDG
jgi:hypothetical protein